MKILLNKNGVANFFNIFIIVGFICTLFSSCKNDVLDGKIIITRVTGKMSDINLLTGDSWRYIPKAQIGVLDPKKGKESLEILTADFFSAQSPSISNDGRSMLFSGQQKENDLWQIWEMDLGNQEVRQMTFSDQNCTDPAYLPNNAFVYSKLNVDDSLKAGHSLCICTLDGSENKRITFNPSTYFASKVLKDGRIMTISTQLYPTNGEQMFMIMLPDGTKAELFYQGIPGSNLITGGSEYSNGKILFIESEKNKTDGGKLISINYNRPLHSRIDMASEITGDFRSVSSGIEGKLLVSYRKSNSEHYSVYEYDPLNKILSQSLCSNNDFEIIDAILIEKKIRPKKLPSEVKMESTTALLLCQDINFVNMQNSNDTSSNKKASKVEILGLNSSLGTVNVEEDGSFYLKIIADKPFQIQTIDDVGHVIHGPSSWIWLRPNERRGCIGCHEDPELAPQNRIPMAVKKDPVEIPVQIKN